MSDQVLNKGSFSEFYTSFKNLKITKASTLKGDVFRFNFFRKNVDVVYNGALLSFSGVVKLLPNKNMQNHYEIMPRQ